MKLSWRLVVVLVLVLSPTTALRTHDQKRSLSTLFAAMDAVMASHKDLEQFSLSQHFQALPDPIMETILNGLDDATEQRLVHIAAMDQAQLRAAVDTAEMYVAQNQQIILDVMECFLASIAGGNETSTPGDAAPPGNCDPVEKLHHALIQFTEKDQTNQAQMGHAGRPSGYVYTTSPGIQADIFRALFWIALTSIHVFTPVFKGHSFIDVLYEKQTGTKGDYMEKLKGAAQQSFASEDLEDLERWRVIMSVFPTFEQFERAMKHNDDFASTVKTLCTRGSLSQAASSLEVGTDHDALHHCWSIKYSAALYSPSGSSNAPIVPLLNMPLIPEFIIATLALGIVFSGTVKNISCDFTQAFGQSNIPGSWKCSNSNLQGSVCILQCISSAEKTLKLDWDSVNVIRCTHGVWSHTKVGSCKSVKTENYDFGLSRQLVSTSTA